MGSASPRPNAPSSGPRGRPEGRPGPGPLVRRSQCGRSVILILSPFSASPTNLLKKSVTDAAVRGRRVLLRVDYNVPLTDQGTVADDHRIVESLPTLHHLESAGARTILMSHLGRPEGRRDERLSLRPVARRLSSLLGLPVPMVDDAVGIRALEATARLKNGEFIMLENLRFHPGEEANDPAFAAQLAGLGEVFVEDAFGAVHRAHASTVGVPKRLPSFAGPARRAGESASSLDWSTGSTGRTRCSWAARRSLTSCRSSRASSAGPTPCSSGARSHSPS